MKTVVQYVDSKVDNGECYAQAAALLQSGEVVAFPTETVYGLGARADRDEAVARIFEAKGRPSDNPLIVHIAQADAAARYAEAIPTAAQRCIEAFWPGPLTAILRMKPGAFADRVTAGLPTVGIRMPSHPVALALIRAAGVPLAAPSANRSGKPSPTAAGHVLEDLDGRIPLILDGGRSQIGVESTIVDFTVEPPAILRPGGISQRQLEAAAGIPFTLPSSLTAESAPKAPGMKYRHYAPAAPLVRIPEGREAEAVAHFHACGEAPALLSAKAQPKAGAAWSFALGDSPEEQAAGLYGALRDCDHTGATLILAALASGDEALDNRLEKASGGRWWPQ